MKQASTGSAAPVSNTTYTGNAAFGSGTQIGATGWYCIYNGTGTSVPVTGLSFETTYRVIVCEYTGSAGGEEYLTTTASGNPANVTTKVAVPTATAATNLTSTGFSANWNTSTDATAYRLDVATDSGFTGFVTGYQDLDVGNVLTYAVTGLSPGTTYHYRVRAHNVSGTSANSNTVDVGTIALLPTVTTAAVSAVTAVSATCGGEVTADGGDAVTDCGVCWSTSLNPTTDDAASLDGAGLGAFVSSLTPLDPGITYHVRAYAINGVGTAYGDDVVFTTSTTVPTVTTTAVVTGITPTTAESGRQVTADGGDAVTAEAYAGTRPVTRP